MIPRQLLSRMGIYNLPVDRRNNLKVVVSDDEVIVSDNLKKLKSSLSNSVVAVDLKLLPNNDSHLILILSSRSFCLVVCIRRCYTPGAVCNFMLDRTVCFVGIISDAVRRTEKLSWIAEKVVELGDLAARVLKKHGIKQCRCLKTLAGEAGVELKQEPTLGANGGELSWKEGILSQNEAEYATHRALSTFLVAEKLLDSIP